MDERRSVLLFKHMGLKSSSMARYGNASVHKNLTTSKNYEEYPEIDSFFGSVRPVIRLIT